MRKWDYLPFSFLISYSLFHIPYCLLLLNAGFAFTIVRSF